jgi:hypothetical protein
MIDLQNERTWKPQGTVVVSIPRTPEEQAAIRERLGLRPLPPPTPPAPFSFRKPRRRKS